MIQLDPDLEHEVKLQNTMKAELERYLKFRVGEAAGSFQVYMYCEAVLEVLAFNMNYKDFTEYSDSVQDDLIALKDYTYDLLHKSNLTGLEIVK